MLKSRIALQGKNPKRKNGYVDPYGPTLKNRTQRKKWGRFAGCESRLLSRKEMVELKQACDDAKWGEGPHIYGG